MPCMLTDSFVYNLLTNSYVQKHYFFYLTYHFPLCLFLYDFSFCNDHQILGVSRCGTSSDHHGDGNAPV